MYFAEILLLFWEKKTVMEIQLQLEGSVERRETESEALPVDFWNNRQLHEDPTCRCTCNKRCENLADFELILFRRGREEKWSVGVQGEAACQQHPHGETLLLAPSLRLPRTLSLSSPPPPLLLRHASWLSLHQADVFIHSFIS